MSRFAALILGSSLHVSLNSQQEGGGEGSRGRRRRRGLAIPLLLDRKNFFLTILFQSCPGHPFQLISRRTREAGRGTWCDFFHGAESGGPHCCCHASVYQSEKLQVWTLSPASCSAVDVVWVLKDTCVLGKWASEQSK